MSAFPDEIMTSDGHKLALREIDPADMLDLIEAAGSAVNGASASAWLGYAEMICSVCAIDNVPVQMPVTKEEIRELGRRIGNKGILALQPIFDVDSDEGVVDTAKN
ncbi:hypothetical protein [Gluconobacter wancherniae]|uniref:Uncharacterized protein n=1 Tax=Gluconobacter wancherniae NBRC 103581 TaxID=656744 RepID=A0A511AZX2_9PROT|nr:hypothetical protein [Gluconobacter wancherniae]MBF0854411.1 hypothetical protein [Gluconobacter wancherniae]GBD57472.1 hypothetical protein NBRC103581_02060 [Gluconobacter wancherniae NBRC 103581]GBR62720.1 hypothetical protein AA103581_0455 [Gluconobacter wancherniae NBRC 103581]GEK93755.1 hypothetical protein GWA01_15250 [Gluconobacter wancherniae NBRC 103581]